MRQASDFDFDTALGGDSVTVQRLAPGVRGATAGALPPCPLVFRR